LASYYPPPWNLPVKAFFRNRFPIKFSVFSSPKCVFYLLVVLLSYLSPVRFRSTHPSFESFPPHSSCQFSFFMCLDRDWPLPRWGLSAHPDRLPRLLYLYACFLLAHIFPPFVPPCFLPLLSNGNGCSVFSFF